MRPLCDLALDVVITVEYNSMRMLECAPRLKAYFQIPESKPFIVSNYKFCRRPPPRQARNRRRCLGDKTCQCDSFGGRDKRGNTMQNFSFEEYSPCAPCRYNMLLAKGLGKEKAKIEKKFLVFLNY